MKKINSASNAENIEKLKNKMKNDSDKNIEKLKNEMKNDLDKKIKALETQTKNDSEIIKSLEGKVGDYNTKMNDNSIIIRDLNNTIMNYEKELDEKKKELEDLQMQPGHRAYLWGILSYLFEYLGWLGENQKGTKIMAMQGRDLRIAFSAFWSCLIIAANYIIWYKNKKNFLEKGSITLMRGICTATTLICPPVGGVVFTCLAIHG